MKREILHQIITLMTFPIIIILIIKGMTDDKLLLLFSALWISIVNITLVDTKLLHYKEKLADMERDMNKY